MTIEEKRDAIRKYCEGDSDYTCYDAKCPLYDINVSDCYCDCTAEEIKQNYEYLFGKEPTDTPNDIINHPSHYCRDGGMESIDEMVLVFGKEAVKNFCLCNVWKYRYRSSTKNGEEDLKKSDWYMRKYKELSNE